MHCKHNTSTYEENAQAIQSTVSVAQVSSSNTENNGSSNHREEERNEGTNNKVSALTRFRHDLDHIEF